MFQQLVDHPGPIDSLYAYGGSQQHLLVRRYAGSLLRPAYVVLDYTGYIDLWYDSELTLPAGVYGVFRLNGIRRQQDWYLCRSVHFLRYDPHPGEAFNRM